MSDSRRQSRRPAPRPRRRSHARARAWPRPAGDLLGTAVAGAGLDRDRGRLFLALSWLGLWLWLAAARPRRRAVRLLRPGGRRDRAAVPGALAVAIEGLRRLDRKSLLPHRPATAIADEHGAGGRRSVRGRALARASGARACAPRNRLKAGTPVSAASRARDPYALRGLVADSAGRDVLCRRRRALSSASPRRSIGAAW